MPSWSPYSFSFDNPIRFVDPDGREPFDWVKRNGSWVYEASITTVEQAQQTSGVTGFAKNGTIVNTRNGYARLEDNNNVTWLPNESLQDQVTNFFAYSSPANSTSEWTNEEFLQITNNGGLARTDFDASTWYKKFADDKIRNIDMSDFLSPNGGGTGAMTKGFNKFRDVLGNLATSFDNYSEFLNKIGSKSQSQDTIISLPVPIGVDWHNGKPVIKDSVMDFKTRKRHPSFYQGGNGNGYDMFNDDIKRQMDSVWNSKN